MILKQKPEDFRVKEVLGLPTGEGKYSYYIMRKKSMNTLDAVKGVAKKFGVDAKRVSFAGLKDRNAVTEQYISVLNGPEKSFKSGSLEVEFLGKGKEQVDSTILQGNEFEITVRGLDKVLAKVLLSFPNYFDGQRFGIEMKNHQVGKALVKKEFLEACMLIGLDATKENCISVLQRNKRLVKLCFSAYQSHIFNRALAEYISSNVKSVEKDYGFGKLAFPLEDVDNVKLPLVQFDTEFDGKIEKIYSEIMEDEGITKKDFIIRQLPFLVSATAYRDAIAKVEGFTIVSTERDDLNEGKKQVLKFTLPKGSYATMLLKYAYAVNGD